MGSSKIVFDQPFSEFEVEPFSVSSEITKVNKFVLQGLIEAFINCIVFGCSGT